jgi:hypothetical protein
MKHFILLIAIAFMLGCSSGNSIQSNLDADITDPTSGSSYVTGGVEWLWGFYEMTIDRDGNYAEVIPKRSVELNTWGVHLNALKLLEGGPCYNCVNTSNVHMTPEGNVSVDISLTHPYDNPAYTGFDVRGIIMFPAHQSVPDDELYELAHGGVPYEWWYDYYSRSEKGDAELVNNEGFLNLWSPRAHNWSDWTYHTWYDYPIFDYYEGKYATGTDYGSWNPFIRYYSNETRHMFEVGKTVTRTFIIKPPAQGPIEAGYAVYAHWNEATVKPVTNPATDFPIDANSAMPYDFEMIQEAPIDPDAPNNVEMGKPIRIRLKHWGIVPIEEYSVSWRALAEDGGGSTKLVSHPDGNPDEYYPYHFQTQLYEHLPDFPSSYPYIFSVKAKDPTWIGGIGSLGTQFWIMDIEFSALDGEW